jgi:hypothetical protein
MRQENRREVLIRKRLGYATLRPSALAYVVKGEEDFTNIRKQRLVCFKQRKCSRREAE